MTEIKNIFARGTNWVGDSVMQIPALKELRRIFPSAQITLYTRSWAKGIYQDADFIDEIILFDKGESKVRDAFAQAKILRQRNFDLAVSVSEFFRIRARRQTRQNFSQIRLRQRRQKFFADRRD